MCPYGRRLEQGAFYLDEGTREDSLEVPLTFDILHNISICWIDDNYSIVSSIEDFRTVRFQGTRVDRTPELSFFSSLAVIIVTRRFHKYVRVGT